MSGADVDGDGDVDLFAASRTDDAVALYVNDGEGSFGAADVISWTVSYVWGMTVYSELQERPNEFTYIIQ